MSDKPTEEELRQERDTICREFLPEYSRTEYNMEGDEVTKYTLSIQNRQVSEHPYMFVAKSKDYDATSLSLPPRFAALSLDDYQSVAVQKNIDYQTQRAISLCAQGKTEEADKIVPGFSEKYKESIQESGNNYQVNGDVYRQMKEDVRQNFAENNPDFLKNTEQQWQQDRENMMLTTSDEDSISISDTGYYVLINGPGVYPRFGEESLNIVADMRRENNNIVQQMRDNDVASKQTTKQTMKNDADRAHEAGDHEVQKAKGSKTHTTAQTKQTQQTDTASKQTTNSAQPNVMAAVINQYRGR